MYDLNRFVVSLALAAAIVGFGTSAVLASDTELTNSLAPGATLRVQTISGFAHVTHGSGPATVSAHAHASDGMPIDMHVAESRSDDSWTVCEVDLAQKSCDGHLRIDRRDEHSTVDLTIRIPDGVKLEITTVSGDIAVSGATNSVAAKSISGDVRVSTTGDVDLATVSGSIVSRSRAIGSAKSVSGNINLRSNVPTNASLKSISGNVELAVPRTADLRVNTTTMSGDVRGSGAVHFSGNDSIVGHNEHATLGSGSKTVDINTISGSISVSTY